MKYYGEPKSSVIDYQRLKTVFVFNENGEFETEDEKLIKWMKKNKNFIKCEDNTSKALYKCKECDFETDNKGLLLAHYRKEHPKTS